MSDAVRLDWIQANTTIKREVEFTDEVDRYMLALMDADGNVAGFWHGNSLRQCIDAGMAAFPLETTEQRSGGT